MTTIQDQILSGERPLYGSSELVLRRVTIGEGESGLKECRHIEAYDCVFEGRYVFWECKDVLCQHCHFASDDRAPLWYGQDIQIRDCTLDAPKAFRELRALAICDSKMTNAAESFWFCREVHITNLIMQQAEYAFLRAEKCMIDRLELQGKYVFQYAKGIEIHNAVLDTKDAFWESEDCVIYDSDVKGEYLGWYAKNLRLVRCRISGTQPLCYCDNLIIEDCIFEPNADLAFEHSSVQATILSSVTSIMNPKSGTIRCYGCGELIHDAGAKTPDDCQIIDLGTCHV